MNKQLSNKTLFGLQQLGGKIYLNPDEPDLARVWFNSRYMTISRCEGLWTLTYRGETTISPEDEIPLAARFLLNYTVKYHVDSNG